MSSGERAAARRASRTHGEQQRQAEHAKLGRDLGQRGCADRGRQRRAPRTCPGRSRRWVTREELAREVEVERPRGDVRIVDDRRERRSSGSCWRPSRRRSGRSRARRRAGSRPGPSPGGTGRRCRIAPAIPARGPRTSPTAGPSESVRWPASSIGGMRTSLTSDRERREDRDERGDEHRPGDPDRVRVEEDQPARIQRRACRSPAARPRRRSPPPAIQRQATGRVGEASTSMAAHGTRPVSSHSVSLRRP